MTMSSVAKSPSIRRALRSQQAELVMRTAILGSANVLRTLQDQPSFIVRYVGEEDDDGT